MTKAFITPIHISSRFRQFSKTSYNSIRIYKTTLSSRATLTAMSGNTSPAETTRVHKLNNNDVNKAGTFVLYWMSNSLRSHYNYALAHASYLCEKYEMPLRVAHVFDAVAQDGKPLPERHAAFQLESLSDVQKDMHERNVPFVVINGSHKARDAVPALAEDAVAVVTDTSYLRKGRSDRHAVATALPIPLYAVEADVVVPVQTVSSKSEYAARTIRPKITRALKDYLVPMKNVELTNQTNCDLKRWVSSANPDLSLLTLEDLDESLKGMEGLDRGAPRVRFFKGGQEEAQKRLTTFLDEKLREYGGGRNEPAKQLQSDLSPYLRSGNISPVDIALHTKAKATKKASWKESEESFLEELIVRRELAVNACWFNADAYDVYEQIVPNFARESLALHKSDKRPKIFTYEELEAAVTEDPYWNAAQLEMVVKGKMHGYMRMYWVKRIIGWVEDPADAMDYAIRLNNRWELDAVDPNSYAGVIWCFGLHDRGWTERPIWGKVRYMNESGLKRKFNMPAYIAYVDKMVASEGLPRHIAELRKKHKMGGQQQTIDGSRKRLRSRKATSSSSKSGLRGSESKSVKRIKM